MVSKRRQSTKTKKLNDKYEYLGEKKNQNTNLKYLEKIIRIANPSKERGFYKNHYFERKQWNTKLEV